MQLVRRPLIRLALLAAGLLGVTAGVAFAVTQSPPPGHGPFSTAYYARDVSVKTITASQSASVVHLDLPAGSYVLNGKVMLENATPTRQAIVTCALAGDSPSVVFQDNEQDGFPMLSAVTLSAAGRVDVTCSTQTPTGHVFAYGASLVATSVANVIGP